jgi:hypothetical protein
MTLAAAILAVLLAPVFLALGTAKVLALQPMRELVAEAGFSTAAYRRIVWVPKTPSMGCDLPVLGCS